MTVIKQQDLIDSVADALQFISYYHPLDFVQAVHRAWEMEQNPAAKDAMAQILINSRMCAMGHRPICQDTGIVTIFIEIGMSVQWDADCSLEDMINEGVRRAYTHPDNTLRASTLEDPAGRRQNTRDNTPAVIHTRLVPGDTVSVQVAAKGGGSENKAKLAMLNPSDSIVDWVAKTLPTMGAGWCPPGILGIGIGGTAEKAMVRSMLSESLRAVIAQTLLKKNGGGRVAAHEIMIGTPAIRNLIREDKVAQMYSAIQTGGSIGMQTMDQCLKDLVEKRVITRDLAREKAKMPENF